MTGLSSPCSSPEFFGPRLSATCRILATESNALHVTAIENIGKETCANEWRPTLLQNLWSAGFWFWLTFGLTVTAPVSVHADTHSRHGRLNPAFEIFVPQLPPGTRLRLRIVKGRLRAAIRSHEGNPSVFMKLAEDAATAYSVPVEYFIRLIHQESDFDPGAVSWTGAQGIAQFMPATAVDRGLKDPFDPAEALPKSAELLSELTSRFGNFGLAAAAYNAGPDRVRKWLMGQDSLPRETIAYVRSITGRDVTDWASSTNPSFRRLAMADPGHRSQPGIKAKHRHWEADLLARIQASASQPEHTARFSGQINLCPSCIVRSAY